MTLVYVLYRDHVLFRNSDSSLYHPCIRECVGWVIKEDEEAVCILFDRSAKPLPNQKTKPSESGLVILKGDILEMRKLE
ncbi:MAG: hypothetical protein D4S01_00565 [Dehalococcoidia bacterium]|nr:MAG: hypothetical protein D4S01_00565 [Dehalococcoidia bacterium]